MKRLQLLIIWALPIFTLAQNVTILPGGITPNNSIQKLKFSEFKDIQNPQIGDIKFDMTFSQLRFFDGKSWSLLLNSETPLASTSIIKSNNNAVSNGICSDSENSIYIAGSFVDSVYFNQDTLVSASPSNIFLYKTNPDKELEWKEVIKCTESINATGITIDSLDNIYVYGNFSGSLSFQSYNATSLGGEDIFIIKLNKLGQLQYGRRFGGTDDNYLTNLKISPSGTIFFCGKFRGSMAFASLNRTSSGGSDGFIAEMNMSGTQLSFSKIGGIYDENIQDFAFSTNSQLVVGGNFGSALTLGTSTLNPIGGSFSNMFLATLNYSNFTWAWAIRMNTNGLNNQIKSLEKGKNGGIYVSGFFSGTYSFDLGSISAISGSELSGFLLQTSNVLIVNWAQRFSGFSAEVCEKVKSDMEGNAILILNGLSPFVYSTYFNYPNKGEWDTQILKFSPLGNLIFRKVFASPNRETLSHIYIDTHERTYFAGSFKNKLVVDNSRLTSIYNKENVFWGFYDED